MHSKYIPPAIKLRPKGFTIVELLIVIIVIAILAAIVIVAYNGIQAKAAQSKINSDLATIQQAIFAARLNNDSPLYTIYPVGGPEGPCLAKASGIDLATLPKTDTCWTGYTNFLSAVASASGVSIQSIVDPWGRPYYVNPNESENQTDHLCMNDQIGTYSQPFVKTTTNVINIPLYKSTC